MCLLGLVAAGAFLAVVPSEYEASALLDMARLPGKYVEEPAALVERLKQPSTYTEEVIKVCGVEDAASPGEELTKLLKATKAASSLVEIRVRRAGRDLPKKCLESTFSLVKQQQAALSKPEEEQIRSRLAALRSQYSQRQGSRPGDKPTDWLQQAASGVEWVYLSTQIHELEQSLLLIRETRFVSPVYTSVRPVYPKRILTVVLGAMLGLILGLLLAMSRGSLVGSRHSPEIRR